MLVCGGREAMVMAPSPMHESAVSPCFHVCLAFLHRHFPPQSPPSHPLIHLSTAALAWDCSTIPKLQLPATAPSRGLASLSRICTAAARTVWFSFYSGYHRSTVSHSFLLYWLRQLPRCGDWTPVSLPSCTEGRSSPTNTPVFRPHSFVVWSSVWLHIFFSAGQVLLSTLRWCSVRTSVSEGVFLMYLRREMYSTSTYSCAILLLYRVTF